MPGSRSSSSGGAHGSSTAPRRVGILGGSFDPVHTGHLHAAHAAIEAFGLDRVVFVPAAQAPHKSGRPRASDRDRVAMLRLAIADEPRFSISDIELRRGGVSFTIDTVRDLPRELGLPSDCAIYLILGSDNLPGLPQWKSARELLERVQPIVVHRDGDPDRMLSATCATLGADARDKLRAGYLRLPPVEVSSTELRARVASADARELDVPAAVGEYIRAHHLYGAGR